jgi:hypothetical protein
MKMSKFLYLWETDNSLMPTDPDERAALLGKQMEMTRKSLDEGQITDWGLFADGSAGYAIGEGTEMDSLRGVMRFAPYVKFQAHPVLSIEQVAEVMKSLTG